RLGRWGIFFAAAVSIAACKGGGGAADGGTPGAEGKTLKVGAALSLTGAAAVYGNTQKNGIQAALDAVNASNTMNGIRIDVAVDDDASSKEQGINVFQKFINQDKVSAIIGPTLSTTATAADPLAQQAKVP